MFYQIIKSEGVFEDPQIYNQLVWREDSPGDSWTCSLCQKSWADLEILEDCTLNLKFDLTG